MVSESLPVVDLRKCKTTKKNTENNFGLKNKFQNQEVKRREPARAFIIYTKTLPSSKGSWEKKKIPKKKAACTVFAGPNTSQADDSGLCSSDDSYCVR